jgi:hypothetical protein
MNGQLVPCLCVPIREVLTQVEQRGTLRLTISQYVRSYFTTDSQSVSNVFVSSTLVRLAARYYFLSECYCLKFAKIEVTVRLTVDITSCRDVTV